MHILDTDTSTLYQSGHPVVAQRVAQRRPDERALTIISVEEEMTGWYTKLRQAKNREQLAVGCNTSAVLASRARMLVSTKCAITRTGLRY